MKTLYLYVPENMIDEYVKYGIKLSEHANKVLSIKKSDKKGLTAYLSPKDSSKYNDSKYICLKINIDNLKIYIYDKTAYEKTGDTSFICDISDYTLGKFEEPLALICSTILPENISIYNTIIDIPLIVENSKEFYYKKSIFDMLDNDYFTSFEVYQLLLILGQKKQLFNVNESFDKIKIYTDKKSNKKYTKKSNF